jgi:AraC-like DNA-binding protein
MSHILTTDAVAPRHRVAYWQEMVCQTFVQAHCDSRIGESFRGSICTEELDHAEISRINAARQRIRRRAVDIARSNKPRYYLCYHAAGHARYVVRGIESLVGPGQMMLLDNCESYSAEYLDAVSSVVLHVPPERLRTRFGRPEQAVGHRLDVASGVTQIAGNFLQVCLAQAATLTAAQRAMMANTALDLFAEVLAEACGSQSDLGTQQVILVARIKQHVRAHLRDPALDLQHTAAAIGVSARYLSRLLQRDGQSFGRYLLQQRVDAAQRALADRSGSGRRISEIALDCGFTNLAHFSRVFRSAHGMRISEIALDCGFTNLAHFSRVFRSAHGMSPRDYRFSALPR